MLAGAGIGAAWIPKLPDQQIGGYVGLALFALPTAAAVWSWVENTWNARHANATVVASAVASANASARSGVATPLAVVPSPSRYAPALIAIPETPAPLPLH